MPRDRRLFMTLPLDFDEHPKVAQLSDAAFRAFVEMNLYSRRNGTDGVIVTATAERRWSRRIMNELIKSHPDRPLVLRAGDKYVIRDYAEHQETNASIAERRLRNAENGSKGGRPPNRTETQSVTDSVTDPEPTGFEKGPVSKPSRVATEKQSLESRELLDDADVATDGYLGDARALGIRNMSRIRSAIGAVVDTTRAGDAEALLLDVTRAVLDLSTEHVKSVESYVEKTCRNSPNVIRAFWTAAVDNAPKGDAA